MPRIYVEIPESPYREAMRRALTERRSTREQIAYDIERLYAQLPRESTGALRESPDEASS